ncbi:MAG: GTPase ObgE [Candidatus Omnitrophota bacterium]|jgi:GTP-binding protein|nr:MAG: GTPase ObgE [Candidatus Omnitrophota bacterium]
MFIDTVKINVKAGNGGKGCKSFYRDKYQRKGIPDGGSGGDGASVVIRADRNLSTLLDFQYNRHFNGQNGSHGSGKNQKGRDAQNLIIRVPCGTVIKDLASGCILRDLENDQEEFVVAKGGLGGNGNYRNKEVTDGQPGQERDLILDLKLIADVGIIGFPNAGKSTLITAISNARPEIASYPFTTKFPVLGSVNTGSNKFIIADIPGLIEGSSSGKGLGDKFLRHIERTKVLLHVIDMAAVEGRDPVEDYKKIIVELKKHSPLLNKKPQVIAANKMDIAGSDENLKKFRRKIKKKIYPISALEKTGLKELIEAINEKL